MEIFKKTRLSFTWWWVVEPQVFEGTHCRLPRHDLCWQIMKKRTMRERRKRKNCQTTQTARTCTRKDWRKRTQSGGWQRSEEDQFPDPPRKSGCSWSCSWTAFPQSGQSAPGTGPRISWSRKRLCWIKKLFVGFVLKCVFCLIIYTRNPKWFQKDGQRTRPWAWVTGRRWGGPTGRSLLGPQRNRICSG